MLPLGAYDLVSRTTPVRLPQKLWFGRLPIEDFAANDDSIALYGRAASAEGARTLAGQYADYVAWAVLYAEDPDRAGLYASYGRYLLQDRIDGIDKLYISDVYSEPVPVAAGDVHRYVCGWGASSEMEMP
jgi:hypothetical protein